MNTRLNNNQIDVIADAIYETVSFDRDTAFDSANFKSGFNLGYTDAQDKMYTVEEMKSIFESGIKEGENRSYHKRHGFHYQESNAEFFINKLKTNQYE